MFVSLLSRTSSLPPTMLLLLKTVINPSEFSYYGCECTFKGAYEQTLCICSETMKWMEEIKKPTAPPHPWLLDRRVTMSKLSDDEREKHEYYEMRAYEACLPKVDKTPRSLGHLESPASNFIQPEFRLHLEPLPPPTTPDESTIPASISQGAGPDSLDLVAFMKLQEEHKRVIAKQRLERRQLLHRANMQVLGEQEGEVPITAARRQMNHHLMPVSRTR